MVEVAIGVIASFAGAILVSGGHARQAFRAGPQLQVDAPIALDLARHHRLKWALLAGAGLIVFILAAAIPHLDERWITGIVTATLAAGTIAVRADYMLCAIDHPDVRLSMTGGFVHGTINDTVVGWLRASPRLVRKITGHRLPAARLR